MTVLGVLGGSFDPVHRGHLALAVHARQALGLERVVLLPCAEPPHKPERALAASYHRLEMLYLAVEGWEGLAVSTFEIARPGRHYTIDTLRALRSGSSPVAPVFLLGGDSLSDFASWRDPETLVAEFDIGVAVRPEEPAGSPARPWPEFVRRRLASPPGASDPALGFGGRIIRLALPPLAVSSSRVRRTGAGDAALADLVPARVARYIRRHGLYTEEARR